MGMGIAVMLALLLAQFLKDRPRGALLFWLFVVAAVPFWAQIHVGIWLPPSTYAAVPLVPLLGRLSSGAKWSSLDMVGVAVLAIAVCAAALFGSPVSPVIGMFVQFVPAYVIGRILSSKLEHDRFASAFAIIGVIVALWGSAEFLLDWHVFENFSGTNNAEGWNSLQSRVGGVRSEGAFGHAIAYGAFLVAALPFVLSAPWRPGAKFMATVIVVMGVLFSLSRGPIVGVVVALVVIVTLSGRAARFSIRMRVSIVLAISATAFLVLPNVLRFMSSFSDEFAPSADYRSDLLKYVGSDVHLIGSAEFYLPGSDSLYLYRNFVSIDNGHLLWALQFGLLFTLAMASVWISVGIRAALIGSPAGSSLIAQFVMFATAALITQSAAVYAFVLGAGITALQERSRLREAGASRPAAPDAFEKGEPLRG
jgi:hypothetical protein